MYGHLEEVKQFVDSGIDINKIITDWTGVAWTLLILASCHGHIDIVKFLIEKGADINAINPNKGGWSAIMCASWNGYIEIVEILY